MNRDKLNNLSSADAARAAFTLLDDGELNSEERLAGCAALFLGLIERHGIDPNDVMTVVKNMRIADGAKRQHFVALADFISNEVPT